MCAQEGLETGISVKRVFRNDNDHVGLRGRLAPGAVGKSVRGAGRFYIHKRVRYTNVRMNSRDWWARGDKDHEGEQTTNSVTG